MEPAQGGGFELYLDDVDVEIERNGERSWRVHRMRGPRAWMPGQEIEGGAAGGGDGDGDGGDDDEGSELGS